MVFLFEIRNEGYNPNDEVFVRFKVVNENGLSRVVNCYGSHTDCSITGSGSGSGSGGESETDRSNKRNNNLYNPNSNINGYRRFPNSQLNVSAKKLQVRKSHVNLCPAMTKATTAITNNTTNNIGHFPPPPPPLRCSDISKQISKIPMLASPSVKEPRIKFRVPKKEKVEPIKPKLSTVTVTSKSKSTVRQPRNGSGSGSSGCDSDTAKEKKPQIKEQSESVTPLALATDVEQPPQSQSQTQNPDLIISDTSNDSCNGNGFLKIRIENLDFNYNNPNSDSQGNESDICEHLMPMAAGTKGFASGTDSGFSEPEKNSDFEISPSEDDSDGGGGGGYGSVNDKDHFTEVTDRGTQTESDEKDSDSDSKDSNNDLIKIANILSQAISHSGGSPKAHPPSLLPRTPNIMDLHMYLNRIQQYFNQLGYHRIGEPKIRILTNMSMKHHVDTSRSLIKAAEPIKCLHALVLAIHFTNCSNQVERFPINFKSEFNGKEYKHVVLGVYLYGMFGALGISRDPGLQDKPISYSRLFDLIMDYKACYEESSHILHEIKIGGVITHDPHSVEPINWKISNSVLINGNLTANVETALEKISKQLRSKMGAACLRNVRPTQMVYPTASSDHQPSQLTIIPPRPKKSKSNAPLISTTNIDTKNKNTKK